MRQPFTWHHVVAWLFMILAGCLVSPLCRAQPPGAPTTYSGHAITWGYSKVPYFEESTWCVVIERGAWVSPGPGKVYFAWFEGGVFGGAIAEDVAEVGGVKFFWYGGFPGENPAYIEQPGPPLDDDVASDPYWNAHPEMKEQAEEDAVDLNSDGVIDADELFKAIDWDGDGLKGNADPDSDGDGEPDKVEDHIARDAGDNRPHKYDANKWPDRDGDGLRDFTDTDGDGFDNIFENMKDKLGNKVGDPLNPNKYPSGAGGLPSMRDMRPGKEGEFLNGNQEPGWMNDDDGDGAPNWVEDYFAEKWYPPGQPGTIPNNAKSDPNVYPDSDNDDVWDFGGLGSNGTSTTPPDLNSTTTGTANPYVPQIVMTTPNTPGSAPGGNPFPSTPPTPGASPNAGGTPAPSVPTPSNSSNAAQTPMSMPSFIEAPALTNTSQPNYVNMSSPTVSAANPGSGVSSPGGASPTSPAGIGSGGTSGGGIGGGGSGGGSGGGEGDGEGGGSYREVWVPRGTSSNWMGAGGGSWKQGAGADHGAGMGSMLDSMRATLANFAPNGLQAYGTSAHSLVFDLPWPTGGYHHVVIPALPDTSTAIGAAVEVARTILRLYCAVMTGWVFYCRVLIVLRQW